MRQSDHRQRRGNAVTLLSSLVTLLGASAFVVDVGFLYASQTQLQAGLDAAALAGVGYFDETDDGITLAREKAIEFAAENKIMGAGIVLADADIEVGYVDPGQNGADPIFVVSNEAGDVDAMRIRYTKTGIPTFFANLAFAQDTTKAWAQSIAVQNPDRGAGGVRCYLPIALPDCLVSSGGGAGFYELSASNANNDNFGWSLVNANNANMSDVNGLLTGGDDCGAAEMGDPAALMNGNGSAWATVNQVLRGDQTSPFMRAWDESVLGDTPDPDDESLVAYDRNGQNYNDSGIDIGTYTIQGPVLLVDAGANGCTSNFQFNQSYDVSGFTWAVIYDYTDGQGQGGAPTSHVYLDPNSPYLVSGTGGGDPDSNIRVPGTGTLVF